MGENVLSKSQPMAGILLLVLDAALIGGLLLLPVTCSHVDGASVASCRWASHAMLGIAAVIAILALVRVFEMDEGERRGLSLACALLGVLEAAIPGVVIELCADASMPCNALLRPLGICAGVAIALVGGIDLTRRLLALGKGGADR